MASRRSSVQVALVTGGSRGLGLELARQLLRRGYAVAIVARKTQALEAARAELEAAAPGRVAAWPCDVGDVRDVRDAVARAVACFGRLDLLVNNAGQLAIAPLTGVDRADVEASLAVHLYGPLELMRSALPELARSCGRIVNVAAIEGLVGLPRLGATVAGKFALVGVTECARAEWSRRGVGVTLVCPGLIRTRDLLPGGEAVARGAWLFRLPGISISTERAARRILRASERRRARLVLTPLARLIALWSGLSPGTMARAAAAVERCLWRSDQPPANTQPSG